MYISLFFSPCTNYLKSPLLNTMVAAGIRTKVFPRTDRVLIENSTNKVYIRSLSRDLDSYKVDDMKGEDLSLFLSFVANLAYKIYPNMAEHYSCNNNESTPFEDVKTAFTCSSKLMAGIGHSQLVDIVIVFFQKYMPRAIVNLPWSTKNPVVLMTHDIDGPFLHSPFAIIRSFLMSCQGDKKELSALLFGISSLLTGSKDPFNNLEEWPQFLAGLCSRYHSSTYFLSSRPCLSTPWSREVSYRVDDKRFRVILPLINSQVVELGFHHPRSHLSHSQLSASKLRLESLYNTSIVGNRSHYWAHIYPDPLSFWRRLSNCGFSYDCTLSSKSIFLPNGISSPFMPFIDSEIKQDKRFVAFPTHIMDAYWFKHVSTQQDADRYVSSLRPPAFLCLDWHIRTLSNLGPWKGYLLSLLRLLSTYRDVTPRLMSAQCVYRLWTDHVEECLWIDHN